MKIEKNYFEKSLVLFILTSFILGFLFKEDSSGGGRIDFQSVKINFLLFKEFSINEINWDLYTSTALPIYYLITKYLIPIDNWVLYLSIFTSTASFVTIILFYKILTLKVNDRTFNWQLFLIATIPMLSPFFRTSAFWALEENIAYLFFLLSILCVTISKDKKEFFIFAIFFASCAFYARQNYAFLSIIVFIYYFNFLKLFTKKNIIICLLFLFFLSPSLYFFYNWGGVDPVGGARVNFKKENILVVLSNFFLYLLPFLFVQDFDQIKEFIKRRLNIIISLGIFILILFIYFFIGEISKETLYYKQKSGAGIIYKIIFHNNLILNFTVQKTLYILSGFIGLLFILLYSFKNLYFFIFSLITLIIFSNIDVIFQEYFDPLIFFSVFLFTDIINSKNFNKYKSIIFVYFFSILVFAYLFKIIL